MKITFEIDAEQAAFLAEDNANTPPEEVAAILFAKHLMGLGGPHPERYWNTIGIESFSKAVKAALDDDMSIDEAVEHKREYYARAVRDALAEGDESQTVA